MTHAVRIHQHGGPEALSWDAVEVGAPGPGEVRLRQTAVGVNFIDVYHRTGLYPVPALPCCLGSEGAGVVEAVGEGVRDVKVGMRVAYAGGLGAYAEARRYPADRLVPLPDELDDESAAALMLKGMTAEYLIRRTYPVKAGETLLVHAAAGGVGLLMCQWARALGATVIGTVSSDAKAELARAHGCAHPVVTTREDFVAVVKRLTGGAGVPVVYDSVGKDTWERSLACLRPRGLMVSFGNASGAVPPFAPSALAAGGSLFLTRPTLGHYIATREALLESAHQVFALVRDGALKLAVHHRYPLRDAATAHRELEARRTTGATVLRV
ncbi:MAG: quinone oxidoreductase [Kofleriaceae bacterium]